MITTADDLDHRFNRHEPLRVVFERALSLVGGHGQPDHFVPHYDETGERSGDVAARRIAV